MVTIKRPAKKPRSTGCNILIFLVLAQLVIGVFFFFTSWPNRDPSPAPAAQGLKDRLRQSSKALGALTESTEPPDAGDIVDTLDTKEESGVGKNEVVVPDLNEDVEHLQLNPTEDKVAGTHAAANYYFADFAYERENPPFRHANVADWTESHEKVVQQLPQKEIRSCQYKSDDHSILFHQACRKKDTKLVAYNSAHFERTWCGVSIPQGMAVEIPEHCDEPVKLFAKNHPPIDGQGMPPIVVTSTAAVTSSTALKEVSCDVPCRFEEKPSGDKRYIAGTEWKIIHTMNDPSKQDDAKVERTAFRQDVYYSTTSFKSSVPLSFFSFDEHDVFAPAVDFDKVDASGSYLVNSVCAPHATKRNRWAGAVEEQFPVKNYGSCAHNTDLPKGKSLDKKEDRMELLRNHRFNLALEAGDAKDHITPVVWEAISSGTLPVILGAQNIKEHLPLDSFVAASGFQKYGDLGPVVAKIAGNKTEWQKYQAWRTNAEYKRQFDLKYNFTRTSPECRMCRWAYAKRYGLGWSHEQQYVHETTIDRRLCLDDTTKLVSKPFSESWLKVTNQVYSDVMKAGEKSTCSDSSSTISIPQDLKLTRTVSAHDNVVDIVVSDFIKEVPGSDIVLRLELPVLNAEGSYFPSPHVLVSTARGAVASSLAIQDSKSKVIVLASWNTEVTSTKEGVVEVIIRRSDEEMHNAEDEMRRIRVVIEDMSELNDKTTEFYPSSFAKLLIQDFVDPLELFYLEA